ncbi:MAG: LysR substrate-binding domain-containing protein [Burkholderiaceae bacterium]
MPGRCAREIDTRPMLEAHHISLRHLRYGLAIAALGSISGAARRLSRTQTAITKALAELERQLDVPLFERLPQGMRVTRHGAILLRRAEAAAQALTPHPSGERRVRADGLPTSIASLLDPRHPMILGNIKLTHFLAVMARQNSQAAADDLAIGAAAVRKSLREIEAVLDERLFERTAEGTLSPTRFARWLEQRCRLAFAEIGIALDEMRSQRGVIQGQVNIGSVPFVRTAVLPRALARFAQAHPQIRLSTREATYADLELALLTGQIDFIVGPLLQAPARRGLAARALMPAPVGLVVRRGHPLLARGPLRAADLRSLTWILPPPGSPSRTALEQVMSRHRIHPGRHCIETSSYAVRRGLLLETDFIAASPLVEFHHERTDGSVISLRPSFLSAGDWRRLVNPSSIVIRERSVMSPAATLCLAQIDEVAREFSGADAADH